MSQTVLILPCEVGTTVYWNSGACVFTCTVNGFYFDGEELRYVLSRGGKDFYKPIAGTKIFFSQSEAEAQLSAEYREEEK